MIRWLYILALFMFPFSALAEECGPKANQFAFEPLAQFSKKSCEDIKASKECQDLYSEIQSNGDNPEDKALQCSDSNIVWRGLKANFDFRVGCAMGGWNYAVDTISTWGHLIGDSAAKIKLSIEEAKAENAACDKDFEKKKAIYADYNQSVPKMLQIEVPDEATLKRVECARLKAGARMMQTRQGMFAMDKVRKRLSDPNAKYNSEEQEYVNWINSLKGRGGNFPDLIGLAEAKLNELGIKLECYNTREAAALVCEGMAMVATNIGGGPAAIAATSSRLMKLSKLAGVTLRDSKALDAKVVLGGKKLTENQKDAVLEAHNVGTVEKRGYRTQGGVEGEYTWGDLKKKSEVMKAADFDRAERRLLMESGITGNPVNPATTLGRADQKFIPNINEAMARRNTEAVTQAASEGNKHYKSLLNSSPAEIKKALPENNLQSIIEANYFGLGTDDTTKLASKYFEAHGYDENYGKLSVISRLRQETKYYQSGKVDSNIADYRVYRNKELEYKLWKDYYESRYPDKYNELDYEKLSLAQRQNLEKLSEDVKKLREQAQKYKWPGYQQNGSAY
jgi:hypothetical protein